MPDPDVPEDALSALGYRENDLLPLTRDRACAMMEQNMTVYVVQTGENPFMAFDREDIQTQPEGTLFAVPREEWEASPEYRQAVQSKQAAGRMDSVEKADLAEMSGRDSTLKEQDNNQIEKGQNKGRKTSKKRTRRER